MDKKLELTNNKESNFRLTNFFTNLLNKGSATIENTLINFDADDIFKLKIVLENYYHEDKLEMPYKAPEFNIDACLWSAKYLYCATHLVILRELDNTKIEEFLQDFNGKITADVIYSVDLCFRYLPQVFNFAKNLSPEDFLVKKLTKTAYDWGFSSFGIELEPPFDSKEILKNKSLTYAYIDRILENKDKKRIDTNEISNLLKEATGNYGKEFYPEFFIGEK